MKREMAVRPIVHCGQCGRPAKHDGRSAERGNLQPSGSGAVKTDNIGWREGGGGGARRTRIHECSSGWSTRRAWVIMLRKMITLF